MTRSELANLPRWSGEQGFYEIWFTVLFEPLRRRAYWFRYTLFTPLPGVGAKPVAIVWMARFDADSDEPAFGFKNIYPVTELDRGLSAKFGIQIGPNRLGDGYVSGSGASDWHHMSWDLEFRPRKRPARRDPALFDYVPTAVNVERANAEIVFNGRVTVDGEERQIKNAPGLQYHLWGSKRVEDLRWLYCKRFDQSPNILLEATSMRPARYTVGGIEAPWATPIYWQGDSKLAFNSAAHVIGNRCTISGPGTVVFEGRGTTRSLVARAWCEPSEMVGYVYRDPDGSDLYVAQSDIASCEVELHERSHPLASWRRGERFTCDRAAALELHGPEPVEGVRYIAWEAEHVDDNSSSVESDDVGGRPDDQAVPA